MPQRLGSQSHADDHFTLRYALWTAIGVLPFVLGHDLDRVFNLYWRLVPVVTIPLIATAFWLVVCFAANIYRRKWTRAISVIGAPVLAAGFYFTLYSFGVSTDRIRFAFTKHRYELLIATVKKNDNEPRLLIFPWGDTGGAGAANVIDTLIYDENGELALPWAQRSAAWHERATKLCDWCNDSSLDENKLKLNDYFFRIRQIYL